jgi:hypothetical protein
MFGVELGTGRSYGGKADAGRHEGPQPRAAAPACLGIVSGRSSTRASRPGRIRAAGVLADRAESGGGGLCLQRRAEPAGVAQAAASSELLA